MGGFFHALTGAVKVFNVSIACLIFFERQKFSHSCSVLILRTHAAVHKSFYFVAFFRGLREFFRNSSSIFFKRSRAVCCYLQNNGTAK